MSFKPAPFNFSVQKPATFYTLIDFEVEGELYNLTGKTATFWIKDTVEGETLVKISSTEESSKGKVVLGGVEGTIELLLEDSFINEVTWQSGVYEVIMYGDPRVDVIMKGTFKVLPF